MNRTFFWSMLLLLGFSSCSNQEEGDATANANAETVESTSISGVVSYRERQSLPPDAQIVVSLVDIAEADEDKIISSIDFLSEGNQIPLEFQVPYDSEQLSENGNFVIKAAINFAGMKIFEVIQPVPVINNSKTKDIVVMMRKSSGPADQ